MHITRDLLAAAVRGDVSDRELRRLAFDHVTEICPQCRDEWLAFTEELRAAQRRGDAESYEQMFNALPVLIETQLRRVAAEHGRAWREMGLLRALPQAARRGKIGRARRRFRGVALALLLVEESDRHMQSDPRLALHWADLARDVLALTPPGAGVADARAAAIVRIANAVRCQGDLRAADGLFAEARRLIAQEGVAEPTIYALVDEFEGSLRKDQRRFAAAEELLARAVTLYRAVGERERTAAPLLALAALYYYQHDPKRAIAITRQAEAALGPGAEPRLHLCIRHNLAIYQFELGDFAGAAAAVESNRALFARFPDPPTQLRLAWLEGKIAAGLGETARAADAFALVRDGFVACEAPYEAAMVSLDLALVYLRQARWSDLRRLAEEIAPQLAARDVHPEALAALRLFQEGARREALSADLIKELAVFLEAARQDPGLRLQQGSLGEC
ncbi:MAG TPA: hypothetical protein VHR45_25420 [Thermoanaerobaculia bacterium]|nr:hypothetical protein [Thermoanaerobaculia bacterium]